MARTEFYGRDATDLLVHAEVLRSIREMPFRDLVAKIEGEEAAAEMNQTATSTPRIAISSFMAVSNSDMTEHSSLPGHGGTISLPHPPTIK